MMRRALYMYGERLPRGPTGHVTTGLGIQPVIGGGQEVVSTFTAEETQKIALELRRSYGFIGQLLGTKAEPWAPYRFCLLDAIAYRRMIYDRHDDPDEQAARLNFSSYECEDYVALMADTVPKAFDTVSHTVAYKTMQMMVAPGEEDSRDLEAYAFMKEGFGYLVSLEMYDTALTYFHSGTESSGKLLAMTTPPSVNTRESVTRWLRENAMEGRTVPLPEVFGRSLNNLDFLISMQAWSFLRFLALYDDTAFRNFPLFLREKEKGAYATRVTESLKQSFGKDAAELERLWLAWLLEIEG